MYGDMSERERRWAVIGLVDGRASHVWLGRATDPTDDEVERSAAPLRERGISAWLAVTEGVYWSDDAMTAVPVRCLSGEAEWQALWDAFLAERAEAMRPAG